MADLTLPHPLATDGGIVRLASSEPFTLRCGVQLRDFPLAYQTFGTLNSDKSNAILVCHALTGDQYLCGEHPVTGKPGWWDGFVGPGKVLDTDRYYVIGSNILGGCMGTVGPKEINPDTGTTYNLDFPVITIADIVNAQKLLLDYLGIDNLFCVIGGSMGGMQVLEWTAKYPDMVFSAIPIAAAARHSAQNIAFHEIARQAIKADPDWCQGNYLNEGKTPTKGLAVARMSSHITYLSETLLQKKFGRLLQDREHVTYGFEADFQIESYLRHQGMTFVERFDANSFLYITRASNYFDLAHDYGGNLPKAFARTAAHFCVISFSSDWLFPTINSKEIVRALSAAAANVAFVEVATDRGHDAFLINDPDYEATLTGFLDNMAKRRGL
ncbi:MAG: homoserine O-acetyltransferase [Alphaproteobacteria bacterium]|nr:homoserine O-acetyltransferase [Alphaproteobacteria bacterium]